jgi:hypothetical protein
MWIASEAGIAQSVKRRDTGWMAGVRFPAREHGNGTLHSINGREFE